MIDSHNRSLFAGGPAARLQAPRKSKIRICRNTDKTFGRNFRSRDMDCGKYTAE